MAQKRRRPMQVTIDELVKAHNLGEHIGDPEFYVTIRNEPWLDLVIERVADGGLSVSHYVELHGDLYPDPNLVFRPDDWRVAESSLVTGHYTRVRPGYYSPDLETLARVFAVNIREQGFAEGRVIHLSTSAGTIIAE
jgi:hypothetical protein